MSRHACFCLALAWGLLGHARSAPAADPSPLECASRQALVAQSVPELTAAITLLEAELPKAGDQATSLKKLLALARYDRGRLLYEAMLRLAAENPALHQAQVTALARQSLADYEQAAEQNPQLTAARLGAARILILPGGDRNRALAALDAALKLEPEFVEALQLRGAIRTQLGQFAEALADFGEAVRLNPKNAGAHEGRAVVLAAQGKLAEAERELGQAIELAPKSPSPRLALARLHLAQKNSAQALTDLNGVLALAPTHVAALALRAGLWEQSGKSEPLLADLDTLIRVQPQAMDVHRMRASLLSRLGRLDGAIEQARLALAGETGDAGTAARRIELGVLYTMKKDPARAAEQFAAALGADPQSMAALIGRGDSLAALGKNEQAAADYSKVIERNPRETYVLNNLAWILSTAPDEKDRDGRRAVELASEACRLTDYKAPSFLGTLAAAHAEKGDFKKAVEFAEKALGLSQGAAKESVAKELASYQAGKPWRDAKRSDAN